MNRSLGRNEEDNGSGRGSVAFGEFEVDEARYELRRQGVPVRIQPKPFALLVHLVKNRHRAVGKEELLRIVWPGVTVSEQALSSALRDLRRALGDTDTADRAILTVRGHGFRFVADVAGEASAVRPADDAAGAGPISPDEFSVGGIPMAEREEALQTLLASLSASCNGEARVSFIGGPAGIGKTRLVVELMRKAKALGVSSYLGRCFDGEGAPPFWPWLQIVRGSIPAGEEIPVDLRAAVPQLAWIAPELATSGEAVARAGLERADARFRLFDAMGLFLRRLSETGPRLLVLEDLHWADEASLLLLEFIVQTHTEAKIHLVATFRDTPRPGRTLSRVLGVGARQVFTDHVDLKGLQYDSVSMLLGRAAGQLPHRAFTEAVLLATHGNPLFVSELAKLVARGELDATRARGAIPVPKRVRDAIRLQLERLSPNCRQLLGLASAVGRQFEFGVLSRARGGAEAETLELLGEAEAAGLLLATREPQATFTFMHDIVRESIYQDVPLPERVRLHRTLAEAWEGLSIADPGSRYREIAYHYSEAVADGVAVKAVHFGRLAGEQANAQMAFEDAVTHYDRALIALSLVPDPDPQLSCELLLSRAEAAWGTLEEAARVQERFVGAANAARAIGNAELFARAALGRTGHGAGPGDFRDIALVDAADIALLAEAEKALGEGESVLRALVLARLALAIRYAQGLSVANELSRQASRMAERIGDPRTIATVLRFRHEVLSGPDFVPERTELAQRILQLSRTVQSRSLELDGLLFLARARFEAADLQGAATAGMRSDALAGTMRHPGAHFRSGIRKVLILTLGGLFEKAERYARQFYQRDVARNMSAVGTFALQRITLRVLQGDHPGAIAVCRSQLANGPPSQWISSVLALEQARAGDGADARRQLDVAMLAGFRNVPDDHTRLGIYLLLVDMCVELGDARSAAPLYEGLLPYEHLIAAPFIATVCQGSVARGLGMLAMLRRSDEAQRHFQKALAVEEAIASPPLLALTLVQYGAWLVRRDRAGDRDRATEFFGRASELAERMGMKGVLECCQRYRLDAGLSPHRRAFPSQSKRAEPAPPPPDEGPHRGSAKE